MTGLCPVALAAAAIGLSLTLASPALAADAAAPEAAKGVAAALQPFVDKQVVSGAVAMAATKDKTIGPVAVGESDLANKRAMKADDLFWIASMSKPMTAAALMMLVDEGKVKIEDPVEKYLPEFHGQMVVQSEENGKVTLVPPTHPITVREVLSHSSGLPFMSRVERKIDQWPLREAVLSYAMTNLRTQPGTKYDYSNAGVNTAGRIIEVVSGMPYEEFMATRLFKPLGMKDTTFWPTEEQVGRLAKSYKGGADNKGLVEMPIDQLTYPLTDRKRGPCPAGGLFSTAADVTRFGLMVLGGGQFEGKRYLSEAAVRTMTSTQTGDIPNANYGLGWSTSAKADETKVIPGGCGHGGAYSTNLWIDPKTGIVTVLMIHRPGLPDGGALHGALNKAVAEGLK